MWFDGEWESTWTRERGLDLYRHCRSLQPMVVVNNRVGKGRDGMAGLTRDGDHPGDYGTPEQEIPAAAPGVDWETCMTMNDHWGYNAADQNYKSAEDLIRKLCDVASKGGNFLLNVGPTADGRFPPQSVERLRAIGGWMKANGEAIYGTSAGPLTELPWGRSTLKTVDGLATIYLHVFDWPGDGVLTVEGLGSMPRRAYLLSGAGASLALEDRGSATAVSVPAAPPHQACSVVALEFAGAPVVYRAPRIEAAADAFVRPLSVEISTPDRDVQLRYTTDGTEPTAGSPPYAAPIVLTTTAEVRARAFRSAEPVSAGRRRVFERVTPAAAAPTEPMKPGLLEKVYRGSWDAIPDLGALAAESIALATEIRPRNKERTASRLSGYIKIPHDDAYVFELTSDDGSRLRIGGVTVVDHDGLHTASARQGTAALANGWHPVTIEWFNKTGGASLSLRYAPLGQGLQPVGPDMLRH
jgi:alpha-L-fucosidase